MQKEAPVPPCSLCDCVFVCVCVGAAEVPSRGRHAHRKCVAAVTEVGHKAPLQLDQCHSPETRYML